MTDDVRRVVELIRSAFRGVTLGKGVGLWEGQAIDDYYDEKTRRQFRARDEKEDRSRFSFEDLNQCHSSLSFFDAEGMRFHLPAFLLSDIEGTLDMGVLFHLNYAKHHAMDRFDLLTSAQRGAVRAFLELRLGDPNYEYEGYGILTALEGYWNASRDR